MGLSFTDPVYLWLLVAIPLLVILHFITVSYTRKKALKFANFEAISALTKEDVKETPLTAIFRNRNMVMLLLRSFTLLFLTLALSGAVYWYQGQGSDADYMLAIDSSSSMLTQDFSPNRLEVAKRSAALFVDRLDAQATIGVVSFAGATFVEQRPTEDTTSVKAAIERIVISSVGGTDLGQAIITATNLFPETPRGKVIILLTDGQSNVGISPERASIYANDYGVTVHAIGIGTAKGGQFSGLNVTLRLEEEELKKIAADTGGSYYHATSDSDLDAAYGEIASSTTQKVSLNLAVPSLITALLLLFLEWILINTRYSIIS